MRYSDIARGYHVFKEGDAWMAVGPTFVDLVESIAGFGDTPEQAVAEWRTRTAASSDSRLRPIAAFERFTVHPESDAWEDGPSAALSEPSFLRL